MAKELEHEHGLENLKSHRIVMSEEEYTWFIGKLKESEEEN